MSNDGGDNIDTDGIHEEPLFLTPLFEGMQQLTPARSLV